MYAPMLAKPESTVDYSSQGHSEPIKLTREDKNAHLPHLAAVPGRQHLPSPNPPVLQ